MAAEDDDKNLTKKEINPTLEAALRQAVATRRAGAYTNEENDEEEEVDVPAIAEPTRKASAEKATEGRETAKLGEALVALAKNPQAAAFLARAEALIKDRGLDKPQQSEGSEQMAPEPTVQTKAASQVEQPQEVKAPETVVPSSAPIQEAAKEKKSVAFADEISVYEFEKGGAPNPKLMAETSTIDSQQAAASAPKQHAKPKLFDEPDYDTQHLSTQLASQSKSTVEQKPSEEVAAPSSSKTPEEAAVKPWWKALLDGATKIWRDTVAWVQQTFNIGSSQETQQAEIDPKKTLQEQRAREAMNAQELLEAQVAKYTAERPKTSSPQQEQPAPTDTVVAEAVQTVEASGLNKDMKLAEDSKDRTTLNPEWAKSRQLKPGGPVLPPSKRGRPNRKGAGLGK